MVGAQPLGAAPTDTSGLRTASIVLFWCASAGAALLLVALVRRRMVWNDFRDGSASLSDLDGADDFVDGTNGIMSLLMLAALIVLCIWSLRTARHARNTGAVDVSPGLACGGWWIPVADAIIPFIQLRRVARHRHRSTSLVGWWQGLLIASWLVMGVLRGVSNTDPDTPDDLLNRLTAEVALGAVLVVALLVTAYVASRAMREVDAA
jgi:hypothetical protein